MPRLYLVYGSNLSKAQMRNRCPQAVPVAPVTLDGWQLLFVGAETKRWGQGGVATIVPYAEASTPAALYLLSAEDERALDGFEGVQTGSYRKQESVLVYEGQPVFTYVANASDENPPSRRYLETIRQGYRDWNLPLAALAHVTPFSEDAKQDVFPEA